MSTPAGGAIPDDARWNHNVHFHPLLLGAVPVGCETALDAGCGEGILARGLAARVPHVTAIDRDPDCIAAARAQDRSGRIEYVCGDLLAHPFGHGSFDFVGCVTVIHHMDERAALERLRDLVRPGGVLAVVGVTRARQPADLPYWLAGGIAHRVLRRTRGWWDSPAPVQWPPPRTWREMRALAEDVLPGVRARRHVLFRYSLIWAKPGGRGPERGR